MRSKEAALLREGSIRRAKRTRKNRASPSVAERAIALADPDPSVRKLALEVISELSRVHASELIAAALFDLEPSVRSAAARCAARVGGTEVVPALIAALGDSESDVRVEAARALASILGAPVDCVDWKQRWIRTRISELRRA